MDYAKESLRLHKEWNGKISINVKCPVNTKEELALAYTPGVAQPCLEIQKDPNKSYSLTWKNNCVAVITDGSAILGLGNLKEDQHILFYYFIGSYYSRRYYSLLCIYIIFSTFRYYTFYYAKSITTKFFSFP